MKILKIVSSGYEQGGVENGIVLSNMILRSHGHQVKVLSSNDRPDLEHYSDFEFSTVPNKGIKKILYAAFNPSAYSVLKKVLKEYKPDVVILHTMMQSTASVLFLLKDYPTAQFVHGPEIFTKTLLPWHLSRDSFKRDTYSLDDLTPMGRLRYCYFVGICRPIYKLGFRNVDKVIALSGYTQRLLKKEKITAGYITNGAKIMQVTTSIPKVPTILYAGRIEKYKGVDDLLRAMPIILKSIPNTKLRIAGDGSFIDELKTLAKKLKITASVDFLGHLTRQQLAKEYANFSVFVMPSTWPETFGKVGIEAMSTGRPVIATDVGGVTDWLKDGVNGFLIQPGQPKQIAAKTIQLIENESLAKKMGIEGRKIAKRFSVEGMTEEIEELINELTS